MYRIYWTVECKVKDIYTESWIERDAIIENLLEEGIEAQHEYIMV